MSGAEWTALAVAAIGALGAVVLQALQMYFSYKRDLSIKEGAAKVEKKVDVNTAITRAGTMAAATNAQAAAESANSAAIKADELAEQLNGKLEERITKIVKAQIEPVLAVLGDHRAILSEFRNRLKS